MTISQIFKGSALAAMLLGAATTGHAQTTAQVPFLSAIAGLPSGGSGSGMHKMTSPHSQELISATDACPARQF